MHDDQSHAEFMAQAVVQFAKEGIRTAIYVNGGAAAGLLRIGAVTAWVLSFLSFLGGLYVAYGAVS